MEILYNFSYYFLLFFIYSFIGYICEVIYCFILDKGKFQNRGFLYGPYCPIYGFGAIAIIVLLSKYEQYPIVLFVMGAIVASIIEYITSYLMEKIFNNKWWDYSNKKFNINGRICLAYALMFGIMGLVCIYVINPKFSEFIKNIPLIYQLIISSVLFIAMIIDTIISSHVAFKLKKKLESIQSDFSKYINEEYDRMKQKQQESKDKISTILDEKIKKVFNDKKSKSTKKLVFKLSNINTKNINVINIIKNVLSKDGKKENKK